MNTSNVVDESSLLRANLLGFATQVKHSLGAADDQIPGLYKRASDYQTGIMTKRAKVRDLVLAQLKPAVAAAA